MNADPVAERSREQPPRPTRARLPCMADEQAALRGVAELMARGAGDTEIYNAVTRGATTMIEAVTTLVGFDASRSSSVVSRAGADTTAGSQVDIPSKGRAVIAEIQRTWRPARLPMGENLTERASGNPVDGAAFTVGAPVIVGERLWGVLYASASSYGRSIRAEKRLQDFAWLLAAAVAHAEARVRVDELAFEQAALLRVAGLVGGGATPQLVFDAVTREASGLLAGRPVTLVRFSGHHELFVLAAEGGPVAAGTAIAFAPGTLPDRVRRGGRTDRVDDYAQEPDASLAHRYGLVAAVTAPVSVAGQVWGMLTATSLVEPLPEGTEDRLDHFCQLISAVLTNGHSQTRLHALIEEQAALRRVAELAAQDAPAEQVLEAVAVEASGLASVEFGMVLRYIGQDGGTQIVALGGAPDNFTLGMRAPGTGDGSVHRVWRTGRAARVEDLGQMSGLWPQLAFERGFTTSAGVPITIRGGLWGALIVAGRGKPFPGEIEQYLASFAEIAATAIAATDARQELKLVAEEQAALRRVAELVARGASLDEVFNAAATESSTLLGGIGATLMRYEDSDTAVAVAACDSPFPPGSRVAVNAGSALGNLRRTRRPVRIDRATPLSPPDPADDRGHVRGFAVPIIIEDRLWGALATSAWGRPSSVESETRLAPFAELVAAAIANAENRSKLTTSRARVVATADEARRRLQRDVHDGAQQRLVHTIIALKLALKAARTGEPATDLLNEALLNAERANTELRELVHGILPASLTRGGLRVALESLVADLSLDVDLRVEAPRLPPHVETTAYFFVAEAMTNVVKHAHATRASIDVDVDSGTLVLEVHDDGAGGADLSGGTGLIGLLDRVEASAGVLTITSERQRGTTVRAVLPLVESASGDAPAS